MAYGRASGSSTGARSSGLQLHAIEPITVAAYVEQLGGTVAKPTVK
jgi:hypothetical protein